MFHGVPPERVAEAGRLRAEAAHLRDSQPRNPDWARIHALLQQSFPLVEIRGYKSWRGMRS